MRLSIAFLFLFVAVFPVIFEDEIIYFPRVGTLIQLFIEFSTSGEHVEQILSPGSRGHQEGGEVHQKVGGRG